MTQGWTVAVVGATGLVGKEMLRVLEERRFPVGDLRPIASPRSAGRSVTFSGRSYPVVPLEGREAFEGVDVALFSAGGSVSRRWCPVAAQAGALVIDNSSAWRLDPEVPLCVPEVNLEAARNRPKGIIANPNCSTIQLVVALKPIHDRAPLRRVVVSTYQAISGAGAQAVAAFEQQMDSWTLAAAGSADARQRLVGNVLMTWTPDPETGYSEEELKIMRETRRILGQDDLSVSATSVRVPVVRGHSEAVTVRADRPLEATEVRNWLTEAPGVRVVDEFGKGVYPTPLEADGTDPVYVGRIRNDFGEPGSIQMWVVSDNIRKGAALNAIQIAEGLLLKAL